jgi:hypothetical protein
MFFLDGSAIESQIGLILLLGFGFWIGVTYSNLNRIISIKNEQKKLVLDRNNQFKQILEKLKTKKTRFKTRVNNTVYIAVKLNDYGKVDILYFLDKRDLSIFQGDKCIYTSQDVDSNLLNEIMDTIELVHYRKIVDVVEILGFIFYREDFEKNFNINVNELKERTSQMMKPMESESDIKNIINSNKNKFDIDEILDKINRVGIENLTKEEIDFLNKYSQ